MGCRAALGALWAAAALSAVAAAPTRVLFVGNSFTFVNDLPHQLINIARSLGKEVEVANSTIGGCTAYYQRAETDPRSVWRTFCANWRLFAGAPTRAPGPKVGLVCCC